MQLAVQMSHQLACSGWDQGSSQGLLETSSVCMCKGCWLQRGVLAMLLTASANARPAHLPAIAEAIGSEVQYGHDLCACPP